MESGTDDRDAARRFVEDLGVVFFEGDWMRRWRGCGDDTDPDAVEMKVHFEARLRNCEERVGMIML